MNKILLLFRDTPQPVIDFLQREALVIGPVGPTEDWQTPLRGCDAVITVVQPRFNGEMMDAAPRLRVIGRPGTGVDEDCIIEENK